MYRVWRRNDPNTQRIGYIRNELNRSMSLMMRFLGKNRKIKTVKRLICEVFECGNTAGYNIQFEDGLWAFVCEECVPEEYKR